MSRKNRRTAFAKLLSYGDGLINYREENLFDLVNDNESELKFTPFIGFIVEVERMNTGRLIAYIREPEIKDYQVPKACKIKKREHGLIYKQMLVVAVSKFVVTDTNSYDESAYLRRKVEVTYEGGSPLEQGKMREATFVLLDDNNQRNRTKDAQFCYPTDDENVTGATLASLGYSDLNNPPPPTSATDHKWNPAFEDSRPYCDIDKNLKILNEEFEKYGFTNKYAKIAMLSVMGKESGLCPKSEGMHYSMVRMGQVWPNTFSKLKNKSEWEKWKPEAKKLGYSGNGYQAKKKFLEHVWKGDVKGNKGYSKPKLGAGGERMTAKEYENNFVDIAASKPYENNPRAIANYKYGKKGTWAKMRGRNTDDGYKFRGRGFNQITFRASYIKYSCCGHNFEHDPDKLNKAEVAAPATLNFFRNGFKAAPTRKMFNGLLPSANPQFENQTQANIAAANVTGGWGKYMTASHTAVQSTQGQNKYFKYNDTTKKVEFTDEGKKRFAKSAAKVNRRPTSGKPTTTAP